MAATLCHIKSRELLPNAGPEEHEEGEEGEEGVELDPRADLIRRLLEYQKYKEAAVQLGDRPVVGRNVWHRGAAAEDAVAENVDSNAVAPLAAFPVHKLIEAFDRVLAQAKLRIAHDVLIDRLSVSQKIAQLTDRLEAEGSFTFSSMFRFIQAGAPSVAAIRHEAVVTFLALLEMAKLRLIALAQHEGDDEIWIARAAEDLREQVARGVAGSDEYR
jgi:segregation and condensation protein A